MELCMKKMLTTIFLLLVAKYSYASCDFSIKENEEQAGCWYVGAGVGGSFVHPDKKNTSWHVTQEFDEAYKIQFGYQFNPQWYTEVNYVDLGSAILTNQNPAINDKLDVSYQSFNTYLGYLLLEDSDPWNVYIQLGVGFLQTDTGRYVEQNHSLQATGGIGLQWDVTSSWQLRLGAEAYDTDAQFYGLSLNHYFGQQKQPIDRTPFTATSAEPVSVVIAQPTIEVSAVVPPAEKLKVGMLLGSFTVNFDSAAYQLTTAQMLEIQRAIEKGQPLGEMTLNVAGHTDNVGSESDNWTLSNQRATQVKEKIMAVIGDAEVTFTLNGYGETQPIGDNRSTAGRRANRRVEVTVVEGGQ